MVDERVVARKLEQIEQYHGELVAKRTALSQTDYLESTTEQRAVERMFENAVQACADLARHVASRAFEYEDNSAKGAVRVLGRANVLDEETTETLVTAIVFRNVLAHEYGHVDEEAVFETLQNGLDVYDAFSRQIASWYRDRY